MQQCKNCYGAVANMLRPKIGEIETLRGERDAAVRESAEWKQEHENLLSVRDADLAALSSTIETLRAQLTAAEQRAREAEKDAERLEFLESQAKSGLFWVARPSITDRGYRVHQTTSTAGYPTVRAAIDAAIASNQTKEG